MGNFYADFVAGSANARQRQLDRQSMQIREDENRRQNEDAQRKADATYREQQAAAEMQNIWDNRGGTASRGVEPEPFVLPEERQIGMFAGAPQREQERVGELEGQKAKLLKSAEVLNSKGFYTAARDMTKQAMQLDEHTLDQRIKALNVSGKEAAQMSRIAQGVYDQGSFENALSDLLRAGYGQQVRDILDVTGGRYSPEAQQALDGIMRSSETAKNAQAMDLALLKDSREAVKQRETLRNEEIKQHQRDQEIAIKRDKLEGKGGPTDANIRAEYQLLRKEAPDEEELDILRDAADPWFGKPDPNSPETKAYEKAKAKFDRTNDFEAYKAEVNRTKDKANQKRKAPIIEPGEEASVEQYREAVLAEIKRRGLQLK